MKTPPKRVPAIDKCFSILQLLAQPKDPLGISGTAKILTYNRSTVFPFAYTLIKKYTVVEGSW